MDVKFTLLHANARLPERGHSIDVGLDVYAPTEGVLKPGPNKVALGIGVEVPVGYNASIYPRTGMASGTGTLDFEVITKEVTPAGYETRVKDVRSEGISLLAQLPPIDPGYTGEVHAIVINLSDLTIKYPAHTRFGQMVFHPIAYARPVAAVDTSRGVNGFNSTGS